MEGRVYKCRLKSHAAGYRIQVVGAPSLIGKGTTIESASEDLRDAICAKRGDGEAFLEFDPPLVGSAERGVRMPWSGLEYNEIVRWTDDARVELWSKGYCHRCLQGLGRRTAVRRQLATVPRADFAGLYLERNGCCLASDRMMEVLRTVAPALDVREIESPLRARRKFFELVPTAVEPFVLSRRLPSPRGWRCPDCGLFYAPQDWQDSPGGSAFFLLRERIKRRAKNRVLWAGMGVTVRLLVAETVLESKAVRRLGGLIRIPVYEISNPDRAVLDNKKLRSFE